MAHDDDLEDVDDFIAYQLVDDPERRDGGWGCAGCLGAVLILVGVLALLGLAGRSFAP